MKNSVLTERTKKKLLYEYYRRIVNQLLEGEIEEQFIHGNPDVRYLKMPKIVH